jgi:hypothetical protein
MRWRNSETPTFAGSNNDKLAGPDIVERLDLLDHADNVTASFIKAVDGSISLEVDGENLGGTTPVVPVKATGAEVNTGTDDAKFLTPKAIEDSDYAKTAAIPVKASAAEVVTGTDDDKFATPKAIKDAGILPLGATLSLETPIGDIDGENDEFVFVGNPVAVFRNGVAYAPDEFTVVDSTVTLDTPPVSGVITGLTSGAIVGEIPTGAVDGMNADFVFVGVPFAVFRNGVLYAPNEFSVAGTTATLTAAPSSGVISGLTQ